MNARIAVLALMLTTLSAFGQAYDALQPTTTAVGTDLMAVQTNSAGLAGQKFTRSITLSNLWRNLTNLFPISASGGTATNAQPPTAGLTNFANFQASGQSNRLAITGPGGYVTNAARIVYVETNQATILSNIVAGASSGDVIHLGAGQFNIGLQSIRVPVGVTLEGSGRAATVISGTAALTNSQLVVVLSSTSVVQHLSIICANSTVYHQAGLGFYAPNADPAPVGAIVRNVYVQGDSDAVFMSATNYFSVRFFDCLLKSSWDVFIQAYAGGGNASSNYVELWNCTLLADKQGSTYATGYGANNTTKAAQIAGTTRFYNCDLISTNSYTAWGIKLDSYADVTVVGGSIRVAATNASYTVDNINTTWSPTTAPIRVFNTTLTDIYQAPGSVITYPPEQFAALTASGLTVGTDATIGGDLSVTSGTGTFDGVTVNTDLLLAYPTLSRALMIDGLGKVTSVTGVGTYVKADGTTGDPSGAGEANVTGEISVTNGTRFGWTYGKSGLTNLLRSYSPRYGLVGTNEGGTNISSAIDPSIVPSQTQLGSASNAVWIWANSVSNLAQTKQTGSLALSNIVGLASTAFTNVPLGGTNISVRAAGGTNFIDTTGQLNNWAQFTTNVWNSRQGGSDILTNISGSGAVTNLQSAGNTNTTKYAVVQNGTNTTGRVKTISAGSNLTITEEGSTNLVLASTASGSSGGTNYPPVIHAGTNITVGVGVRQHRTISTNASFGVNFQGTPLNGETVRLSVSNYAASVVYWTNFQSGTVTAAYDPSVASNVTVFAVPALSIRNFEFAWHTNFQANASVRQELQWSSGAELELQPGFNGLMETNGLAVKVGAATNLTINSLRVYENITNGGIARLTIVSVSGVQTNNDRVWLNERINQTDHTLAATLGDLRANTVTATNALAGSLDVRTNLNAATIIVTNSVTSPLLNAGQIDVRTNANVATLTVTNSITTPRENTGQIDVRTNANVATLTVTNSVTTPLENVGQIDVRTNANVSALLVTNLANVNFVTNVIFQRWNIWTNYVQTVSNFVFDFKTNRYELKNQTNIVFTNIVEEATAVGADMAIHVHNTTGVTMGLVWPAYGAQHGYFFQTNVNNPILTSTSLTTGKHGVASFTAFGTNIFATWTEWP